LEQKFLVLRSNPYTLLESHEITLNLLQRCLLLGAEVQRFQEVPKKCLLSGAEVYVALRSKASWLWSWFSKQLFPRVQQLSRSCYTKALNTIQFSSIAGTRPPETILAWRRGFWDE
ncbi:hypothetical protein D6C77_05439, partial [Aureobasidium pullulans]